MTKIREIFTDISWLLFVSQS